MNITLINGSPKGAGSMSQFLLDHLQTRIAKHHSVQVLTIRQSKPTADQFHIIEESDVLVFAFPLYIDAIPAHLFQVLVDLEKRLMHKDITVYGLMNCGFFEGIQNKNALAILENWCRKAGLVWGMGIGCGGGEGIRFAGAPIGKGPLTTLGKTLDMLADHINEKTNSENLFTTMDYPRVIYQIGSRFTKWYPLMRKNGVM